MVYIRFLFLCRIPRSAAHRATSTPGSGNAATRFPLTEGRKIMKNGTETLALAAVAATLTLAACLDEAPAEIAQPDETVAGDPAVYAPDGWPLQLGETTSREQRLRLQKEFLTYGGIVGIHLVGSQVYGARYSSENGPTIYMGHFPKKANWGRESVAERESVLPVRFRGNIEYLPPPSFVRFDEDGEAYVSPEYYEQRGWPADVVNRLRDERRKR